MKTICIKTDDEIEIFLTKIAQENGYYSGERKEPSLGKALKNLVKWCVHNNISLSKKHDTFDEEVREMIEQIHVAIPNLMYLSRMNAGLSSEAVDKKIQAKHKEDTISYINETCGAFQNITYNTLRVSINRFGIKGIPSDKEATLWR